MEAEDEFFTAHNTLVQQQRNRGVEAERGDGTITDLGTLVIIDDDDDLDTMKSELPVSLVSWVRHPLWPRVGVDTGVMDKEGGKDYRPGFMQHFDKNDEQMKKRVGRKQPLQGPHNIAYYFPDVPEGVDFRDHVSCMQPLCVHCE